jgi:ubiquinone/menaquinone biosynthesis C-methylase UbiE
MLTTKNYPKLFYQRGKHNFKVKGFQEMPHFYFSFRSGSKEIRRFRFSPVIALVLFLILQLTAQVGDDQQRDEWQQPGRIMDSVGVKAGMKIGEIGAGEGYFTFKLANRVGKDGLIYANDISDTKLNKLREHIQHRNITNVQTVKGKEDDPLFPDTGLEIIIMVYVFHDLSDPVAVMKNTKKYLRSGGAVVIVDRDPDRYGRWHSHFISKDEIVKSVEQAGYSILKILSFLPRDNIYICRPQDVEEKLKSTQK